MAIITASAPGISGKTVNELKRNGAVSATAPHANVAADAEPESSRIHSQPIAAASAAIKTSMATTPGYPNNAKTGTTSTGKPTGCTE